MAGRERNLDPLSACRPCHDVCMWGFWETYIDDSCRLIASTPNRRIKALAEVRNRAARECWYKEDRAAA
jgi:hypothetical protein